MSWARYWATRARAPLKRRAATPLAARSWLTRLNSTPAAPPTPETGGAVGRGRTGGRTGAGRTATGAGAAEAASGVAVGGGATRAASCPRPLAPACRDRKEATWVPATGRLATGRDGCDPSMVIVATASSGAATMTTTLVTDRDIHNPPCGLTWRRRILGRGRGRDQTVGRPRNPPPRPPLKGQSRYQAEAATKKRSWPSNCPGRMTIIAR